MAETFEELHERLQETQAEYLRTLQLTWDAWLKQYDEMNKKLVQMQQDALAQVAASCTTPTASEP